MAKSMQRDANKEASAVSPATQGKRPARKAVSKRPATARTAARKAAAGKSARKPVPEPALPESERRHMVAEAAYYLAEKRGFADGDPMSDWVAAEAQIDAQLRQESLS